VQLAASVGYWIQLFIQRVVIPITISAANIFCSQTKNYIPRGYLSIPYSLQNILLCGAVAVYLNAVNNDIIQPICSLHRRCLDVILVSAVQFKFCVVVKIVRISFFCW
jgi:hypothetical protein